MRLFIIAIAVVLIDQFSKYLVVTLMELRQSIVIVENFLYITYIRNPGAAFGLLPYRTSWFIVITIAVSVLLVVYYYKLPPGYPWMRLGLSLQLGGALGNLIDRIRADSYVVDFINFKIWPPVFNLADSAIVVGIFIFIISLWRSSYLESERS